MAVAEACNADEVVVSGNTDVSKVNSQLAEFRVAAPLHRTKYSSDGDR